MSIDNQRAQVLFLVSLGVTDPAERATFLERECRGDPELLRRVETLLQAHQDAAAPTGLYSPPTTEAVVGNVFAGRYKIRERLGEGVSGVVYVADETEPVRRRVALRIIKTGPDSERLLARFEQDSQALTLLDHPNIAKVFDACAAGVRSQETGVRGQESGDRGQETGDMGQETGVRGQESGVRSQPSTPLDPRLPAPDPCLLSPDSGPVPYVATELIRGVPITKYCDDARLTLKERLELFIPVCQAVQHAHQKGVMHGALKPSNIIVSLAEGRPTPKVIDFAVSALSAPKLNEWSGQREAVPMTGTPEHLSPEQAGLNNLDVDFRADVYALGGVLYELITGTTPFSREELKAAGFAETLRTIKNVLPPNPSTRLSGSGTLPKVGTVRQTTVSKLTKLVRGDLDGIVMKALEKDRSRRYQTADALALDIQRHLADEPVTSSASGRLGKFVRRNRARVIAAGLVLLALLAGVGVLAWELMRAQRQRQTAEADVARANALAEEERTGKANALAAVRKADERLDAGQKKLDDERRKIEVERKRMFVKKLLAEESAKKALEERRVADLAREFLQDDLLEQETAQAEALFLRGSFAPEASRDVPMREVLDRAAAELAPEKIEANFPKEPLLQAELLRSVGAAYSGAGEHLKAVALLERADKLLRPHLNPEDRRTLTTKKNLALAYLGAGRTAEGIQQLEQVRDVLQKHPGPDHPETLLALNTLGVAYGLAGMHPKAIGLLQQVRAVQAKKLPPNHPDLLATLHNLARAHQGVKNLPEAIKLFDQVHRAREKNPGPHHPVTLATLFNLAMAHRNAGNTPEAVALLEKVREGREKAIGPSHTDTLETLNALGVIYWSAKDLGKSIPLFKTALERYDARFGRSHPDTIRAAANLGVNYVDDGRLDDGIPLLEEAYRKGKPYPSLNWVGNQLLNAYVKANKGSEAAKLIAEQLALSRKEVLPDSPQLAAALALGGKQLLELKQYDAAEPLLRESLELREKLFMAKSIAPWLLANSKSLLGGALLGQVSKSVVLGHQATAIAWGEANVVHLGIAVACCSVNVRMKYKEAEKLLVDGYEGLKKEEKAIPPQGRGNIPDAIARLIDLYDATDRKSDADRWRKVLRPDGKTIMSVKGRLDMKTIFILYEVNLLAGKTYIIDMTSPDTKALDPYLILMDPGGAKVAEEDDRSKDDLNARIIFEASKDGTYRIRATSFGLMGVGEFALTVKERE